MQIKIAIQMEEEMMMSNQIYKQIVYKSNSD